MGWRNTALTYGGVAKGFHWVIAVMVLGLLAAGIYMTSLDPSPEMFKLYALHKSAGITVLTLVVLRVLWRITNPHPESLPNHKNWEKILARLVHFMLYAALFIMPLSGWVMSSAKGFSVSVFGLLTLPDFVERSDDLAKVAGIIHEIASWVLIGIVGLHIAGAIKHHIVDRDETLWRMLPSVLKRK